MSGAAQVSEREASWPTIVGRMFCRLGAHAWGAPHVVNIETSAGTTSCLTICFRVCPRCGKSYLEWIYNNGRRS